MFVLADLPQYTYHRFHAVTLVPKKGFVYSRQRDSSSLMLITKLCLFRHHKFIFIEILFVFGALSNQSLLCFGEGAIVSFLWKSPINYVGDLIINAPPSPYHLFLLCLALRYSRETPLSVGGGEGICVCLGATATIAAMINDGRRRNRTAAAVLLRRCFPSTTPKTTKGGRGGAFLGGAHSPLIRPVCWCCCFSCCGIYLLLAPNLCCLFRCQNNSMSTGVLCRITPMFMAGFRASTFPHFMCSFIVPIVVGNTHAGGDAAPDASFTPQS